MRNIKPPTFDGEHKKYEDADTWVFGMRKYNLLVEWKSINVVGLVHASKAH
jgi:hypothetical protein